MGRIIRTKIDLLHCKHCNSVIWSRHIHDFRSCSCGRSFIDGGGDYTRYGGDIKNIEIHTLKLPKNALVNSYEEYVEYVNAKIDLWKKTDFLEVKPVKELRGYSKVKEVIEWIRNTLYKPYLTRK